EVRGIGRFVAAHADRGRDLGRDVPGRILGVLAAGPVAHLALHVLPSLSAPCESRAAHLGAIDAGHASRLLPSGDVAADTVEAELLADADQRLIAVRVARLRPGLRRG